MMRWIGGLAALVLLLWLLFGVDWTNPLGATTREQLRTKAAVEIARVEAQAQVETAQVEAAAAVQTTTAWTSTLPVLLLIVVGGALAGIVLYFRGKAYLTLRPALPCPFSLRRRAALALFCPAHEPAAEQAERQLLPH